MKVKIDKKTLLPKFVMENEDLEKAEQIEFLMQHPGWKVLYEYLEVGKEAIEDFGIKCSRDPSKTEISSENWARLDGWRSCMYVAGQQVVQLKEHEAKKKQEEEEEFVYGREREDE